MKRKIVAFHQDSQQDWVAELECGHQQHVRHTPPWMNRLWVLTDEGRAGRLGAALECAECGQLTNAPAAASSVSS